MFAGSEKLQQVKVSEAHSGSNTKQYSKLREMHKAIFALLQNPTLFFLNLAGASEGELRLNIIVFVKLLFFKTKIMFISKD